MKKILTVFLILAVTSLTNATTVWTITAEPMSPAYEITVSVVDNPEITILLALVVDSDGILSDFAAGPDAPEDSYSYGTLTKNYGDWDLSRLGQGEIWHMLDYMDPIYDDGDWLTADFAFATGSDSSVVSLYQISATGTESFLTSHTMVPEPVTLSLLALGSLFLCRRR